MKPKIIAVLGTLFCAGQMVVANAAAAQFPDKPIRIVVPFAAGGGVDALARPFARVLGDSLKQNVIVENKPSATGQIGAYEVARSAPDGYTLLISSAAFGTTPAFYPKVNYSPTKDFEPVTILATAPQLLLASNEFKANSVPDIIRMAKAGDKLNVALTGITGIQALSTHLLSDMAKIELMHVPYKGAGAAFPDLIGSRVDIMFDNPGSSLPHVRSGKIRVIATTGTKRMGVLPNVPTVAETLPGFEAANWFILAAPAGTPQAVLDLLNKAAVEAINSPAMKAMLAREGTEPLGTSREEGKKFLSDEVAKWARIVNDKKLQVQE